MIPFIWEQEQKQLQTDNAIKEKGGRGEEESDQYTQHHNFFPFPREKKVLSDLKKGTKIEVPDMKVFLG